jgi:glyoxylase-like metal-dependent hydrolase (beta-lactamase superfamily II)
MTNYEIYPLPLARGRGSEGYMTYLINYDKKIPVPIYCWYIKGPKQNILVDTGCPIEIIRRHRPDSDNIMDFEVALERVGLVPEKIDIIIQTHLHYDHCGNASKCKNAEVIVQKKEAQFALAPHPLFAGTYDRELFSRLKLHMVEGDTVIDEGICLLDTPGHTPGCQSVAVKTAKGSAIITGFCCNMHVFELPNEIDGHKINDSDKLESMWPVRAPGIHTDALQAFDSALKVKGLADILIPIHDPMFEKIEKIPILPV